MRVISDLNLEADYSSSSVMQHSGTDKITSSKFLNTTYNRIMECEARKERKMAEIKMKVNSQLNSFVLDL